jgi:hypothetical protein
MNRKPLYTALVLTALLLALHLYALATYFYWYHRWFDIPMHILAGMAIGWLLLAFFDARKATLYFFGMLAVGVGWEIFENVNHISTGQPGYWFDTIKDIVDDLIGAGITFYIAKKTSWH